MGCPSGWVQAPCQYWASRQGHKASSQIPPQDFWPRAGLLCSMLLNEVQKRSGTPNRSPRLLTAKKQDVSKNEVRKLQKVVLKSHVKTFWPISLFAEGLEK